MELIGHVLFLTIWETVIKTFFFLLFLSSGKIKGMCIETRGTWEKWEKMKQLLTPGKIMETIKQI